MTLLNLRKKRFPSMQPCRFGGDEFLVILPLCDKQQAIDIANEIKETFDHQILNCGGFEEPLQISAGVATICEEDTVHELISRCDQNLYFAKRNGKHQIHY
jgi:diguanylate cyclase (GGDEF)-like protein